MLAALRRSFDSTTDIEIVGQAQEFDALMRLVTALRPDVLLVDLGMTTRSSAKSLASLAATCACPVIAMSLGRMNLQNKSLQYLEPIDCLIKPISRRTFCLRSENWPEAMGAINQSELVDDRRGHPRC